MVVRVTAAQRFSVALRNILTSLNRVQQVQEQIVTGKQILRPSDDPAGFSKVTSLRALLSDSVQFRKNIDASKGTLNVTDQTLASIRTLVQEARTLAIGQAGAPADATTRIATASQVARIRDSIMELANTQVGGRYIFAGTAVTTRPFSADGSYLGNDGALRINLGIANPSSLNVAGTEFLTTDLDPDLFRVSAYTQGTAPVSDRYRIDTAGADANNAIVVKSSPSGTVVPVTFVADMSAMTVAGHNLAAASALDGAGTLVAGREYSYVVSAVDSTGESIQSEIVSQTVGVGDDATDFSFDRVAGAVSYRVYRVDETEYATPGAGNVIAADFQTQDSLIGTVFDTGLASYTFRDTGQAQQAGESSLAVSSAQRTFTGTELAGLVQLRVNNNLKEVTSAIRTIRIVEANGLRSADITVAAGLKTGHALAAELETAINASTVLAGSTAAVPPGAGYTVDYDPFTDKFTIAAGSPVTEMQVDVSQGGLAGLMGFKAALSSAPSVTSDTATVGVKVTYDTVKDIFTFRAAGGSPDKIQVISAGTNPASTAANLLGFTVDSIQTGEVSSNIKTAFNILSGQNDTFSVQVDGGTSTSITALAEMSAPASGLATAELNSPGGSLVVGREYAYAVSAVDVTGESIHSAPVTRTVTAGNNAINFTFDRVPGAVSYRIYRLDDTEYAATGAAGLEGTDFEQQDSLIGTVNDLGNAGPASYTFTDTGQAQQAGERALGTATGMKVFTGEKLADILELRVNNEVKQVAAGATTIRILEDGGVRSDTISITAGTKGGYALATELEAAINASTVLTGSTAAGGAGYTVTYDAVNDEFSIQVGSPGANVGVDVAQGGLAALMGFQAVSPFAASVISDTTRTGAQADFNDSFKDSFTISSPSLGATSSVVLAAGGNDILATLNLAAGAGVAADSTRLADLNGGDGVSAGSISVTNRAGQTFTVDLSTAVTLDDVFTKIEATVTGVTASISDDGKRIILEDANSPQVSNLIVREVGTSTTASDLGIKADVPGDIVGLDVNPAVSSDTIVAALRDGAGVFLGTVDLGGQELDLALGSRITVTDILAAINTAAPGQAEASISADGHHLRFLSLDASKSALITDVTGRSAQELGFQGSNDLFGLLQTLEEALLRNDSDTVGRTLDVFTDGLERVGLAQVQIGQVTQQFDRFKSQQEEVEVSFTEVLSSVEDADIVEAMTKFSIYQNTLQAALASSAQILQVQLLDFLR